MIQKCSGSAKKNTTDHIPVSYHRVGQVGVNLARNKALNISQADIIYFIDDDCLLPTTNHIEKLVTLHKKHPSVAAIGGGYVSPEGSPLIGQCYNSLVNRWIQWNRYPKRKALPGGNVSYKKNKIYPLKFNPKIRFGGDESEFHLQLQAHGHHLLYFKQLDVLHSVDSTMGQMLKKALLQGFNKTTPPPSDGSIPTWKRLKMATQGLSPADFFFTTSYLSTEKLGEGLRQFANTSPLIEHWIQSKLNPSTNNGK